MTRSKQVGVLQTEPGRLAAALLAAAGPTMSFRDAARVLEIHASTLYEMNRRGDLAELGIGVLQLGRARRICTADLRRVVGDTIEPRGAA